MRSLPLRHAPVMLISARCDWSAEAVTRPMAHYMCLASGAHWQQCLVCVHFRMKPCFVLAFLLFSLVCLMYQASDACSCGMSHPQDAYCHSDIGKKRECVCVCVWAVTVLKHELFLMHAVWWHYVTVLNLSASARRAFASVPIVFVAL